MRLPFKSNKDKCSKCKKKIKGDFCATPDCIKEAAKQFNNAKKLKRDNSLYTRSGQNKNTRLNLGCGCNIHNIYHNCDKLNGQRLVRK